jgi:site-specific recombinase XerD
LSGGIVIPKHELRRAGIPVPGIIAEAGERTAHRFIEFFAATIRNKHTRIAYVHAVARFLEFCEVRGLTLDRIDSLVVAMYIEHLTQIRSAPTVKLHLAAIRVCLDWLVSGGAIGVNPAWSVRGPKHVVKKGKTPVLSATQARELLDSIDTTTLIGLRDRALIGVMVYSFARVGAVVKMNVEDYWQNGKRWWIRLHEKGGKHHEVPAHHNAEAYLDAYIHTAAIGGARNSPLFRTFDRKAGRAVTERPMNTNDVLRMIKRRARRIGLPIGTCCHTFRATGITAYLENGGTIENAQAIAAHESPRTTKLYDRTSDEITLDEIEKISI